MKVTLETKQYEWSHGKKPKGHGYWMYRLPFAGADVKDQMFSFNGTLTDLKKVIGPRHGWVKSRVVEILP